MYNAVENDDDDVDVTFMYCSASRNISKMFLLWFEKYQACFFNQYSYCS